MALLKEGIHCNHKQGQLNRHTAENKNGALPTSTHPAVQRYKITTLECNNIIAQLALQFPMVNQHLQSEHHCKGVTYGFSKGKGFRLHFEIFVARLKNFSLKHFPF